MPVFPDNKTFRDLILTWPDVALEYLYEHYYHILVQIAERRTHDRKAAEDIAQEAIIGVWKNAERLCASEGFLIGPYLMSFIKKKSITFYRQSLLRRNKSIFDADDLAIANMPGEFEILGADRHGTLRGIVLTLPQRQRECLLMRFFDEMSIGSIADKLGISKKAVEKNITKGLKRLRTYRSTIF